MYGPQCVICDRGVKPGKLSDRGWCAQCEGEFIEIMSMITCASDGGLCVTPTSCLSARKCMQVKAAMEITKNATAKFASTRRVQNVSWGRLDCYDALTEATRASNAEKNNDKMP